MGHIYIYSMDNSLCSMGHLSIHYGQLSTQYMTSLYTVVTSVYAVWDISLFSMAHLHVQYEPSPYTMWDIFL